MKRAILLSLASFTVACASDASGDISQTVAPTASEASAMAPSATLPATPTPTTPTPTTPTMEAAAVTAEPAATENPTQTPPMPTTEVPAMATAPTAPAEPTAPTPAPTEAAPVMTAEPNPMPTAPAAEKTTMTFFVTSRGHQSGGNFGGLDGADAFCQELATAVGCGDHNWHAYLSTDGAGGVNARDRIGTGPWVNQVGITVAESVEQLHANGISNGPNNADANRPQHIIDENGAEVPPGGGGNGLHDIATGTQADGTVQEGFTCNNWTQEANTQAWMGHSDVANAQRPGWNDATHSSNSCIARTDNNRGDSIGSGGGDGRIYCFAID